MLKGKNKTICISSNQITFQFIYFSIHVSIHVYVHAYFKLNDFMEICVKKRSQSISMQLNEFSHCEHTCIISTQNKKQK